MLAQIADLRLYALMSLRPYVPAALCPCALLPGPLCRRLDFLFKVNKENVHAFAILRGRAVTRSSLEREF